MESETSDDSSEDSECSNRKFSSLRSVMSPGRIPNGKSKTLFPSMFDDVYGVQEHARARTGHSSHVCSLSTSLERFRSEFDDMKGKMSIFSESLGLCKCIALDFNARVAQLEARLARLEKKLEHKNQNNYSYIIKKNKHLSQRTINDARKLLKSRTEDDMREVAGRICRNYLHGAWKTVKASDLQFSRITGGLSNFIYYVALPDDLTKTKLPMSLSHEDAHANALHRNSFVFEEPKQVLLRIYGQFHGERATDAIVTESVIFTLLSERRLGPKLYGVFSGGRIEEYIPGRPLLPHELSIPSFSMKIAEKMAAIHSLDIPLSKEPTWLFSSMTKWVKNVKEIFDNSTKRSDEETEAMKRLRSVEFGKEADWLKKFLASVESPSVFCHNDLQEGNILYLDDTHPEFDTFVVSYDEDNTSTICHNDLQKGNILYLDETHPEFDTFVLSYDEDNTSTLPNYEASESPICLYLIDFEYCAYNYRGFDIANHFQEWGFDYSNPEYPHYYEYPERRATDEQKERFAREYLKHYNRNTGDASPTAEEVDHLLHEVDAFALASNLLWCVWSIVNASRSQITFGYWEYANSRLDIYIKLKQEVLQKNKSKKSATGIQTQL